MAITFKTFGTCVPHVTSIRKPVLLRARHGVGKSSVVYDYAASIGLPVIERRASQMTEGDLLGMPKVDDACTRWLPPDWLKAACDAPCVLFIDEIDRATTEVRQGFFELTDSRKVAGSHLHDDTLIFAAVNGGEHGAQYQVGEMDPAELDRWTVFDIEPDVKDWLNWAKDNEAIDKTICDFIRQNPNHLEHSNDFEPNKVYPSRRSWHRLSDCLVEAEAIVPGEHNQLVFNLSNAFVGLEAAFAFTDFVKTIEKQLTPKDIINKGRIEDTKNYDLNEHTALVEKFGAGDIFKKKLTAKQIGNLSEYFVSLPSEVAMKLWTIMGEGDVQNVIKLHQNPKMGSFLIEILKSDKSLSEKK